MMVVVGSVLPSRLLKGRQEYDPSLWVGFGLELSVRKQEEEMSS